MIPYTTIDRGSCVKELQSATRWRQRFNCGHGVPSQAAERKACGRSLLTVVTGEQRYPLRQSQDQEKAALGGCCKADVGKLAEVKG